MRRPTVEELVVLRTDGATVGWAVRRFSRRSFVLLLDEDGRRLFDWAFTPVRRRRLIRALEARGRPVAQRPDLLKTWGR